jgi:hypothetical protein
MRTPLDDVVPAQPPSVPRNCGVSTSVRSVRPVADVLIVLDHSTTMRWSLTEDAACRAEDTECSSRLAALTSAIETLIADNPNIHWGLEIFPAPNSSSCAVSPLPQVEVGPASADAISAQFSALVSEPSTPTTAALEVATSYLKSLNDENSKAILLATDGLPTCNGSSRTRDDLAGAVIAATAAKEAGFPVYVIGIGPGVSNLNSLALAGGTRSHYPVTSIRGLNDALGSIAKVVSLCTFKADKAPSNRDLVYVYVDQQPVARDPENGWIFDASDATSATIALTGASCQSMLAETTSTVEIVQYECAASVAQDGGR